jgi:hypothetical protein
MDPVDAKFGMTGPFSAIAKTYGFTGLKVQAGCDRPEYFHRKTDTVRCDSEYYNSWGIERQAGPFGRDSIAGVNYNEGEEVGFMHEVCRNPETVPAFGELLLKTDYLILPFLNITCSVNGKGELPSGYDEDTRGQVVSPFSIASCRGSFTLNIPETIQRDCSEEYPLTDFWTWTVNFGVDEKSTDPDGTDHLITLSTEAQAFMATFCSLSRAIVMSENAPPRLTETITNYPDT